MRRADAIPTDKLKAAIAALLADRTIAFTLDAALTVRGRYADVRQIVRLCPPEVAAIWEATIAALRPRDETRVAFKLSPDQAQKLFDRYARKRAA